MGEGNLVQMLHQPPYKILLAEDDPELRETLSSALISAGYGVTVAEHGIDVIFLLQSTIPDVALYSLDLPTVPGYDVLTAIRTHHPEISVIAMSRSQGTEAAVPDGVFADGIYIKDKANPELLLKVIAELLATSEWRRLEHRQHQAPVALRAS